MASAEKYLVLRLTALEGPGELRARPGDRVMEFHLSRKARVDLGLELSLFRTTGNVIIPDFSAARSLARRINEVVDATLLPERAVRAGRINAMGLIDEILHGVSRLFREGPAPDALAVADLALTTGLGKAEADALLLDFVETFPPLEVYRGKKAAKAWLAASALEGKETVPNRHLAIEEFILLVLANENPAFGPYRFLFDDGSRRRDDDSSRLPSPPLPGSLADRPAWKDAIAALEGAFSSLPGFGPDGEDLVTMLRSPMKAAPYSLPGQLDWIRRHWGLVLGEGLLRLLGALDLIKEEEKPRFPGPGPTRAYVYRGMEGESERFSPDRDWMPNVVLMAKSTLVWLSQLSRQYGRDIRTLDQVPDEELDLLALRGFNALWLIGLWERSQASAQIKRRNGNPEAAASAYSLFDYEIAAELGGWSALANLRERASYRGIRLAADMVPNHTGIDSAWVRERPELFMSSPDCPFPGYTFNGPDLSGDGRVGLWLEDGYWDRTDAAVVFKRLERATGKVDYIYHGNDGTGLPWSDTAQIDFLKAASREAVKERILHVAKNFPIIRFDAAMVLAKGHFRRLWYPEPGSGGDVPSRAEKALSLEDFDREMPAEFWREVVDLCAKEAPDTLLLAEAFWMMEGYFVRSLGMHRVYNSAFMNMLKREENAKYRETIRNTQEFDKDILKRFVNFMNNPDEDTAVAQFGKGDKYIGVCTVMATMPGLPMFGHGQLEGLEEKYGMEYRRAYRDEVADPELLARHEREIYPLLKRRRLFSGVEDFLLYDLVDASGSANDNVFAYSNGCGSERALVVYNNSFARAGGRIRESCAYAEKLPGGERRLVRQGLAQALGLHAQEGRFLVMREDRAGLWFIRPSQEVAQDGLGLILDGYQCQIFLDIFEVADDEAGLYAAVCRDLGGRGVPDLSEAVEDMALKDLYTALAALATREAIEGCRRLVEPGLSRVQRKREAEALAESLAEPAQGFYAGVLRLLREEGSGEGPETAQGAADAPAAQMAVPAVHEDPALEARDRLLRGLASLAELPPLAEGRAGPVATAAAEALATLGQSWMAETAFAHLVLDGLAALAGKKVSGEGARRIAERFFLERKLREALRAAGMPGDKAYQEVALASYCLGKKDSLAQALASWLKALPGTSSGQGLALNLVEGLGIALAQEPELRQRLGINLFEGVEWFHKEGFEGLLQASLISSVLGSGSEGKGREADRPALGRRLVAVQGLRALLLEAEADSSYRVDLLLSFLRDRAQALPLAAPRAPKKAKAVTAKPDSAQAAPATAAAKSRKVSHK